MLAGVVLWAGCASAVTGRPGNVTGSDAYVAGLAGTSTGGQVEHWVQYGTTTAYGSETPHSTTTIAKGETRDVYALITGLELSTTYHYRFCASDSEQASNPGCGADQAFTTPSVDCGGTVTTDVKLTAPMDCQDLPGGVGWTIGADGVDVNLGGYSFNGSPTALGIRNDGHDDVTIRNGSMRGWISTMSVSGDRNAIRGIDGFRIGLSGADNEIRRSGANFFIGGPRLVFADNEATAGFGSRSSPAVAGSGLDGARILRNEVQGGPFEPAIEISGSNMRILENEVVGSSEGGIVLLEGDGSVIRDNSVTNATAASGDAQPQFGDGIFVGPLATGTLLRGNYASSNAGDGIEVRSASTRLLENQADSNGDLGIEAVAGVTDLGGNRAFGNGNPLQCLNITCF